jgi:transcriptional regulator with PAS, ATPase and Fis domain
MDIVLSKDAESLLYNYDWPGNIRELKNTIEFSVNMMDGNEIKVSHLPTRIQYTLKNDEIKIDMLSNKIQELEKQEINKAIKLFGNDIDGKRNAAKALGISLATLYNKLK